MYVDSEMEGDFSYRFAKDSTVKKRDAKKGGMVSSPQR